MRVNRYTCVVIFFAHNFIKSSIISRSFLLSSAILSNILIFLNRCCSDKHSSFFLPLFFHKTPNLLYFFSSFSFFFHFSVSHTSRFFFDGSLAMANKFFVSDASSLLFIFYYFLSVANIFISCAHLKIIIF